MKEIRTVRTAPAGYLHRDAAAAYLGVSINSVSAMYLTAPSELHLKPPVRVISPTKTYIYHYHRESLDLLNDYRKPQIPEGFIEKVEASKIIGVTPPNVSQWCRRRRVQMKIIRQGASNYAYFKRSEIELYAGTRDSNAAKGDQENVKNLRQLCQLSNDEIEQHPAKKRILQAKAAKHLGMTVTQYIALEESGKPLPLPLFIRMQSLKPEIHRRARSGRYDYHTEGREQ